LTGHATNVITGLAVSLQDAVLPVTVITAGMWIAYSVAGGLYDHGMEGEGGIEQP
jgi:Na+/H+-translocating membrane pyrophosphatase